MEASNVDLILRARAFGVGPWGRRPGAIVALYAALYEDGWRSFPELIDPDAGAIP